MSEKRENDEIKREVSNQLREEREAEGKSSLVMGLGILALIIIIIVIIALLLKGCSKKANSKLSGIEKTLLDAGKEYYESNPSEMPSNYGICNQVTLSKLIANDYLDEDDFEDCNAEKTYVKVCMLENKKYQYVPILTCDSLVSEDLYGNWKEGKLSDVVENATDVRFQFLAKSFNGSNGNITYGEEEEYWGTDIPYENYTLVSKTTYYRERYKEYKWNTFGKQYFDNIAYFMTAPNAEFSNRDDATAASVSKYYKNVETTGAKEYAVDSDGYKIFSQTTVPGYPLHEEGYLLKSRSRSWTEKAKPTPKATTAFYVCRDPNDTVNQYVSMYECGKAPGYESYNVLYETKYSCDGGATWRDKNDTCYICPVPYLLKTTRDSCGEYGNWHYSGDACTGTSDVCQNLKEAVTFYRWYRYTTETVRSYYPTNSATSLGTNYYYQSAPANGYYADTDTTITGYKFYKSISGTTASYSISAPEPSAVRTNDYRWTDWSSWTTTPLASGNNKAVDTKTKVIVKQIIGSTNDNWNNVSDKYLTAEELIAVLKAKGYEVNTINDIFTIGELKSEIQMYVRNKK